MYNILEFLKQYQILALGGAGVLTFLLREVPKKILFFIWTQISTSVSINNRHQAYYYVLDYLSLLRRVNINRNLSLSNEGYWDIGSDTGFKLGYGYALVRYNGTILLIRRTMERVAGADRPSEDLIICSFTRDSTKLCQLLQSAHEHLKSKTESQLYQSSNNGWECLGNLPNRPLESVILAPKTKTKLVGIIESFIASESFYQNLSLSYKLNILLSGKPGTGKTSIILALATHLKRNVYFLRLNTLTSDNLNSLLSRTVNGIVVLEELDTHSFSESREIASSTKKETLIGLTLGDVLNTLDGILTKQGNIIIATTNYFEKLDSALVRDGRFDLKLELEYFRKEQMIQLINRFYPEIEVNPTHLPDSISPATLQKLLLENNQDYNSFLYALSVACKVTVAQ